jgi:hypothetical protein
MNVPELEAPNIELREASDRVAKAAELYASGYTDGTASIKTQERGHTEIIRSVRALKAVRSKWGMDKHIFFWCELCREYHCEYCAQTDDTEGAADPCPERLASFTK